MHDSVTILGQLTRPAAIFFDMDGTLTAPLLDFAVIRAEMGAPRGQGILEWLHTQPPARRGPAEAVLLRHEAHAAENATLNPGCRQLLDWLRHAGIATALITRNSRRCAEIVCRLHALRFEAIVTREDAAFKPDPAPLRLASAHLRVDPSAAWMVGDGEFDVLAGHAAGCPTVWLSHGRDCDLSVTPWQVVPDLSALHNLLKSCVS